MRPGAVRTPRARSRALPWTGRDPEPDGGWTDGELAGAEVDALGSGAAGDDAGEPNGGGDAAGSELVADPQAPARRAVTMVAMTSLGEKGIQASSGR